MKSMGALFLITSYTFCGVNWANLMSNPIGNGGFSQIILAKTDHQLYLKLRVGVNLAEGSQGWRQP